MTRAKRLYRGNREIGKVGVYILRGRPRGVSPTKKSREEYAFDFQLVSSSKNQPILIQDFLSIAPNPNSTILLSWLIQYNFLLQVMPGSPFKPPVPPANRSTLFAAGG